MSNFNQIYSYCHVFLLLLFISQIRSENTSVSREGLREEQLLPVRISRDAPSESEEGSGYGDGMPIRALSGQVMQRMTDGTEEEEDQKVKENNVESNEEDRSKETVEIVDEGSGESTLEVKDGSIKVSENVTQVTIKEDESVTEENGETQDDTEVSEPNLHTTTTMAKEDEVKEDEEEEADKPTTIPVNTPASNEISLNTTTMKEEETTTTLETTTIREITMDKNEETALPEIVVVTETGTEVTTEVTTTTLLETTVTENRVKDITKFETTTSKDEGVTLIVAEEKIDELETEKVPVTEIVEVKHVKAVYAAEVPETTAAVEEEKTESATIMVVVPAVGVTDNDTHLENSNFTAGTDTLLMKVNSRLLDTNEKVLESSKDPSKLGTYIVVSLILLSFLSLVGFILMKRRVQKRRRKSNIDPEGLDTEKALLSLSEYKDHPDGLDEGKIKNNEITPIVIKSNSQINKFEKNTNFSSPKNLNTKANEKNIEKDNVLKKTSDNLTQVIIEDPTKDVEEEKSQTNAEKLIVRTHLDQDSIPKKPVIVNRTSLGCVPVSQD